MGGGPTKRSKISPLEADGGAKSARDGWNKMDGGVPHVQGGAAKTRVLTLDASTLAGFFLLLFFSVGRSGFII